MGKRKGSRFGIGTITFILIYGSCLLIMYFTSTPTETERFTGRTAHEFTIATVAANSSDGGRDYGFVNLERLQAGALDVSSRGFLLPEPTITINVGDIHRAEVLDDHGAWQLVAFYYSNTRTSTSIYRAYEDRIEPVSYRRTSSVGHLFAATLLLVPALLASAVTSRTFNWLASRSA